MSRSKDSEASSAAYPLKTCALFGLLSAYVFSSHKNISVHVLAFNALVLLLLLIYIIHAISTANQVKQVNDEAKRKREEELKAEEKEKERKKQLSSKVDITARNKAAAASSSSTSSSSAVTASHSSSSASSSHDAHSNSSPLLLTHLRGHMSNLTNCAYSKDGKFVVSTSEDETFRVWNLTEAKLTRKLDSEHAQHNTNNNNIPYVRMNTKNDIPTACTISDDSKYVVVALKEKKNIVIYALTLEQKVDATNGTSSRINLNQLSSFPTSHKEPITTLTMSSHNAYIISLARGVDTHFYFWSLKGTLLFSLSTSQLLNYTLSLSMNNRFIAVGTKLTDVKVWHLKHANNNVSSSLEKVELMTTLKGHKRGISSVQFSHCSNYIVTASLDGSLRLWDINVNFTQREDPKLKWCVQTPFSAIDAMIVSPHDKLEQMIIIAAHENHLMYFHGKDGSLLHEVQTATKENIALLSACPQNYTFVAAEHGKNMSIWNLP